MFALFLILIFIRPFISSLAYPAENYLYSLFLLAFLGIWLILKRPNISGVKALKFPLALFIAAILVSLAFSSNITISLGELYKYVTAILLLCIALSLSEQEKNRLLLCIVMAGCVISLCAIYQYFFGFQNLTSYVTKKSICDPFILDYIRRKRVFFPFVTPNTLAGYLAMIIPLALAQKYKFWLIIHVAAALLLTKSLGGFLSLFLGLAIYFYLKGHLKKKSAFFLFGLFVIILGVLISRSLAQKMHTQPLFSAIMRLNYWQETLKIIRTQPWTGVGLGNFNLAPSRYAHNSYLQIWAEMGILGIISFLWLIIAAFSKAGKSLNLMTASVVFLIHNFVDFTFFLPEVSLIWWVILGLC